MERRHTRNVEHEMAGIDPENSDLPCESPSQFARARRRKDVKGNLRFVVKVQTRVKQIGGLLKQVRDALVPGRTGAEHYRCSGEAIAVQ